MVKSIGKCNYCGDPLITFQEYITIVVAKDGKKYHEGCHKIMEREKIETKIGQATICTGEAGNEVGKSYRNRHYLHICQ